MTMPYIPPPENDQPEQEESLSQSQPAEQESPESEEPQQVTSSPAAQLPPEARGEANGGPLGCCFGVSMGLLLTLSIVSLSIPFISHLDAGLSGFLAFLVNAATAIFVVAATFALAFAGWKIGRRVFREYEPSPGQQKKRARLEQRQIEYARRQRRHV